MKFLLIMLLAAPGNASASDPRALELLKKVDDLWRGDSSYARMSMRVKTKRYERSMTLEAWSKGTENSLIRILEPRKEKGVATLKAGRNIYTYLPKTDRTIKLSSGMMGGSWMGSHFSNDDLVQESRLSEDFEVSISFEGRRDGVELIELTLMPKPDAAVVWGKMVSAIEKGSLNPLWHRYYDEELKLARTMSYHDVKTLGGRRLPARMRLVPQEAPDEFTEISYEELKIGLPLDISLFSLAGLKKGGKP